MVISVVGNAKSLFDKENGYLIDQGDEVIRFNGGIIKNPKSQGHKTTILAYAYYKRNMRIYVKRHFGNGIALWPTMMNDGLLKERQQLSIVLDAKPSNGIIVLERLKNEYASDQIQIFGFDWKATPTWYNNTGRDGHNYDKEREYCLKLINRMGWELF